MRTIEFLIVIFLAFLIFVIPCYSGDNTKVNDELIKEMAVSGEICRVIGHVFIESYNVDNERVCQICGQVQKWKSCSEWVDVNKEEPIRVEFTKNGYKIKTKKGIPTKNLIIPEVPFNVYTQDRSDFYISFDEIKNNEFVSKGSWTWVDGVAITVFTKKPNFLHVKTNTDTEIVVDNLFIDKP